MWFHRETSSVFYVDSDYESLDVTNNKMETEVQTLKQELSRTREALKVATKKCRDLVRELDSRTAGHESERTLRDQQLSRILRALLVLEARLKQEQKSIRQLLREKDNVIRNQQLEIAKLRRYTKNYIKSKRDNLQVCREAACGTPKKVAGGNDDDNDDGDDDDELSTMEHVSGSKSDVSRSDSSLSKDIQKLKCEIITKLNGEQEHGFIRKNHSFAESDISKTSGTSSSENTDVSIITTTTVTTTDSSPSLLSTEGFCEGESTDVSPGSTLNKSNRCTPTMVTDVELVSSDNETMLDDRPQLPGRRIGVVRTKPLKLSSLSSCSSGRRRSEIERGRLGMIRTDSKDDGMDCNFASDGDDDDDNDEPIYENAGKEKVDRNTIELTRSNLGRVDKMDVAEQQQQQSVEETSGNWYSDPDEDRTSDDVFRSSSYRSNSNHNSVLECVNQILLRDMEEEDNVLSVPKRYRHRGRIVRFQPARLSDIESVGSEMERRNSDENGLERDALSGAENTGNVDASGHEAITVEDEFGMKIVHSVENELRPEATSEVLSCDIGSYEPKVIPIVIIEPKVEAEESKGGCSQVVALQRSKMSNQSPSPTLKMERIEEKTCLQMSTKGLTIARNLDYEDIESLPEVNSPKTPPALPPKPQFKNNTLILKKIPSPSFLINETHKKQIADGTSTNHDEKLFGLGIPAKSSTMFVRSLTFDDRTNKSVRTDDNDAYDESFRTNKFNNIRSSFQSRQSLNNAQELARKKMPKVTNIVRHFEEFKIGESDNRSIKDRAREKQRLDYDHDLDIRQNFEEFNLDECDLSDDPDRPEGDGSDRLSSLILAGHNENTAKVKENAVDGGYDHFLEATGLSTKSILTPSRLLSNHKSMLKPKDVKYKNKIKATAVLEKHGVTATGATHTHVKHWTGPFV